MFSGQRMVGLVLDPWRFDPIEAVLAANEVIRAGTDALALLRQRISVAYDAEDAMSAVVAARIAVAAVPVTGRATTFRPDAPSIPHHPFVISSELPFLAVDGFEAGGAWVDPADVVEWCFRDGVLEASPFEPAEPIDAALELLASETWDALILPEFREQASRMVRWQAVRATGGTDVLARLDPMTTDDEQFEEWWSTNALLRRTVP